MYTRTKEKKTLDMQSLRLHTNGSTIVLYNEINEK